ncbi:MAG: preprotein translocase subunit SecY [Eubacteriales bacterium]
MIFTLIILVLFRIGSVIPVPFVYKGLAESGVTESGLTGLFQYFDILSGETFSKATLFALSISPYITASIVIQLLTIAIPPLERMAKEGEEGRKKLTQITRYTTVGLALLTSIGYCAYISSLGWLIPGRDGLFEKIVIVACYCAGASIIMWLAEKINEHGIGNGISIILFVNIAASFPSMVNTALSNGWLITILFVIITLAMILFIVHVTNAERRLPVQYAKRQVGRKMYGGQSTFLPIKLNMSGVMPIIFASSIAAIPTTIAAIFPPKSTSGIWYHIVNFFSMRSWFYMVIYFVLIIAFAYFYLAISFNPVEVSNNLKKNGGFITGIRPGKPTTDYISKILGRVTLIGAIFLGIVACLPLLLGIFSDGKLSGLAFGGSSLLILVSVVIETQREIEAQMTMRHYKGFLE